MDKYNFWASSYMSRVFPVIEDTVESHRVLEMHIADAVRAFDLDNDELHRERIEAAIVGLNAEAITSSRAAEIIGGTVDEVREIRQAIDAMRAKGYEERPETLFVRHIETHLATTGEIPACKICGKTILEIAGSYEQRAKETCDKPKTCETCKLHKRCDIESVGDGLLEGNSVKPFGCIYHEEAK